MEDLTDYELDQEIKKVVREMVESVTPPPVDESWARFEAKLDAQHSNPEKHHYHKSHLRLGLLKAAVVAGAAVLIVGLLSCAFPVRTRAIGERLVERVTTLLNETQVNMRLGYQPQEPGQAQPNAPDEGFKEVTIEPETTVSLDEARARCPFPIAIPKYLPGNYKLDRVKLQELNKPLAEVTIDFAGPDSHYFSIVYLNAPHQYGQGFGYDIDDTSVEDFKAKDAEGKIAIFRGGTVKAMWIRQGVVYTLEGNISKEEALKTIESM